ncbi:uncharacterized protein MONOS_9709 [Monocercomonoides exilis]|uniref:uncharacterized protein n=1 Tax=Monocercomonoides exilis TaxID=2049356 RepID=UPI00355A2785|nr:hypothetical protein MONOS_9709 [Monocercomonoides exilis]|eukprot:MONOS_9709.1-p1 / transcript=MONOS_9709.1 / gene=MONOS_9709 / organism=Monocercomonoides_exilis_PA203 / gene_product=unspecified product / transcript_product=unspecified product / location=Mono_scaffold00411:13792-14823(-) / protein_length=344 / sequence_SO=supercontig / SO=protein_coding / is_pseudo=false
MSSSSPSSSSPSSSISSFSLPPLVTVLIPYAILGKSRLGNEGVLASSSVSATRDVFEQQRMMMNNTAYVASQGIRVGREKEGKKEKKDEKRNGNKFISDKDEKGSLSLTDKCIENEKDEVEEENGFGKDIRKAQKKRGAKEKMNTTKEKNNPATILRTLCSDFLPEIKNRRRIQQQIIGTRFFFLTFIYACASISFTSSSSSSSSSFQMRTEVSFQTQQHSQIGNNDSHLTHKPMASSLPPPSSKITPQQQIMPFHASSFDNADNLKMTESVYSPPLQSAQQHPQQFSHSNTTATTTTSSSSSSNSSDCCSSSFSFARLIAHTVANELSVKANLFPEEFYKQL